MEVNEHEVLETPRPREGAAPGNLLTGASMWGIRRDSTPEARSRPDAHQGPLAALVVEDNADHADLIRTILSRPTGPRWKVEVADRLTAALDRLPRGGLDVVVLDMTLPDSRGAETVRRVCECVPEMAVVVVTASDDEDLGVQTLRRGAQDFLVKGEFETASLGRILRLAIERKRAQTAMEQAIGEREAWLKESETRYRVIFEQNPFAMWVFALDDLRFLAVNDAACWQYGYGRDEFLEMTLGDVFAPEDVPALVNRLGTEGDGPGSTSFHRHRRRDGSELEVEVTSGAVTFGGCAARLVLAHDVTERRSLEAQLEQAQKLDAMGRLAGGVAHDFNNLIGVISGYGELLRRSLPAADDRLDRVMEILKAADRAASLTRQLLAFSRKQVLLPTALNLNAVMRDMEAMLRRVIGEHIQLVTTFDDHLGRVIADPAQLSQIVVNLAVNARDAMPEGGRLILETANESLGPEYGAVHPGVRPGPYVMLAVSDTGTGMSTEVQSHIFEPFFTTKEQGKGTGLGLAMVHGIVRQSGGHIYVYSEPGEGTAFRIYLPRVDHPAASEAEAAKTPAGGSETVLLVEDELSLREMIVEVLQEAGYTVMRASGGDEAVGVAAGHAGPIDLVITDVVMPGMTGLVLARQLTAARPALRVVYMSGYTEGVVTSGQSLEPGATFVQKPFAPDALLAAVRQALDGPGAVE